MKYYSIVGLAERGERDGHESSFVATSTPNNDCQTMVSALLNITVFLLVIVRNRFL